LKRGSPVRLNLELTAKDAPRAVKRGDLIVVVDVLRCTSTIITALANGAEAIIPVRTLREAYKLARENPNYILAGERGGLKPRGFKLGNSPLEFRREVVEGRTIILTTTSGTVALTRSRGARTILVGALLNAEATAKKALEMAEKAGVDISIVLSGKKGRFSLEDFICAGAIGYRINSGDVELSDAATAATLTFHSAKGKLFDEIRCGEHAKHLINLGLEDDVKFCCRMDLFNLVPIYRNGVIKPL